MVFLYFFRQANLINYLSNYEIKQTLKDVRLFRSSLGTSGRCWTLRDDLRDLAEGLTGADLTKRSSSTFLLFIFKIDDSSPDKVSSSGIDFAELLDLVERLELGAVLEVFTDKLKLTEPLLFSIDCNEVAFSSTVAIGEVIFRLRLPVLPNLGIWDNAGIGIPLLVSRTSGGGGSGTLVWKENVAPRAPEKINQLN